MFDAGKVTICQLANMGAAGSMPEMVLTPLVSAYFGERVVGYGRFYEAKGANEQIDLLIRVWRCPEARIGCYAVLEMSEYDGQYRITNVQNLLDDDGLKVTDITLQRVDDNYAVSG